MNLTPADLAAYCDTPESEEVHRSLFSAEALVTRYVGSGVVPAEVLDSAILEVGSELFNRVNAPSGIMSLMADGVPVRTNRDPMTRAYPLLLPFLGVSFA